MTDAPMTLDTAVSRFFPFGGVTKAQLLSAIHRGDLACEKIGRAYLVTGSDIRAWRNKCRVNDSRPDCVSASVKAANPDGSLQQRGWDAVVKAAGLGADVTPHVLKHSCATMLLRDGVDLWDVSGLTSTSTKTLESVYGHHSPEFQKSSAKAFRRKA